MTERQRAEEKTANWLFEKARKEIPDLTIGNFYTDNFSIGATWAIDLLLEFRNEGLRESLKDFNGFMCKNQWDGRIPTIDKCIDEYFEYLKTK